MRQGANSYGQLAQGDCDDRLLPKPATNVPANIKLIHGGGGHTLVIAGIGKLYTCGSNNKGQLGLNSTDDVFVLTPVTVGNDENVTIATGGWDFSLAITESSDLYSWGSNTFGQLGDSSLPNKCLVPRKICEGLKFIQVAAGLRHVVALAENGDVYCWGHSKKGQCAVPVDEKPPLKVTSPTKVMFPAGIGRVVSVSAGSYHTVALTDQGQVLVWGCNKYGQSTQSSEVKPQVNTPYMISQKLFGDEKVKLIQSGWTHLIAQTDSGALYSWGRGDYGQLGRSRPEGTTYSHVPAPIDTCVKVSSYTCGSEHTLFLADGKVYALGWNEHGLCATGDEVNVQTVTLVAALENQTVIYIACGGGHCFAITKDNKEIAVS
ncbi:secretion-regulating guanine nucleotide exchange factor-like isoform X2 [Mercenaria mercenaria]|uniref:secretion-regulating guanine nucleotide exchange factor-like isoform X2 n=1 Tax=Mercenaria mercenaria TaxID=6596 RepID=UPI00234F4E29|nr:secretion-regulating guanine nucleotide exchange factor-like isoform X2 [Mercenaria mercenaria]